MTRTIGFVCEGPRDSQVFEAIIDHLYPDADIEYRYIQPEETCDSSLFNGWKGVLRWCHENGPIIDSYLTDLEPKLDALIIHLDGDVSRSEKESHCYCDNVACIHKGNTIPPNCREYETCPITLPCAEHVSTPEGYTEHLLGVLTSLFPAEHIIPLIFVFPCDSTDTWIVAALDSADNYEQILNPWNTVITRGKIYHGVRIRKPKKTKLLYAELIKLMIPNWEQVKSNCPQALKFEESIVHLLANTIQLSEESSTLDTPPA